MERQFGKTVVIDNKIVINAFAVPQEYSFSEVWQTSNDGEIFEKLYHIATKDISKKDFDDFAEAYLFVLNNSEAEHSHSDIDKDVAFRRTIAYYEEPEEYDDKDMGVSVFDGIDKAL